MIDRPIVVLSINQIGVGDTLDLVVMVCVSSLVPRPSSPLPWYNLGGQCKAK